jgi:hypothetical protein
MRSYVTSYNALLSRREPDSPAVERIEIPLIQRDYAQGRESAAVERIRASFLDVLHDAVTGGRLVSLDFVYGDIENGTLRPLDGQQRLTTLFLLHWYLASRAQRINQEQGWKRFSYATRPSARLFCERLAECQPSPTVGMLSVWIEDQPWYLHTWRHDPSIQSMLVMLDAIHERFKNDDCPAAWERLIDPEAPAISFHLLPIEQMGLAASEDLYIKMNSRGKPLTPFENFKARFEQVLEASCPERVQEFALKLDGEWTDLLWPYRGADPVDLHAGGPALVVDDKFMRYFHFVTELCEWNEERFATGDITSLAERVYGPSNPKAAIHLDFLFQCFDTWVGADIASVFSRLFTLKPAPVDSEDTSKVVLFGPQGTVAVDLFGACCDGYGETRGLGHNRVFSWPQTLLLYAVLLHRIQRTEESPRRLRILRNLIEASSNELRLEKMPALLADVNRIVVDGVVDDVTSFNRAQVADERLKSDFLVKAPGLERALFHLEDHPILRGCLAAFELDDTVFESRARAFHDLFVDDSILPSLTGALLTIGDYWRPLNQRVLQLGSGSNPAPWRELLAGDGRPQLANTRDVLGRLLDRVAQRAGAVQAALDSVVSEWMDGFSAENGLDWRWYFVKYPAMREGRSGRYVGTNGALGYTLCMLDKNQMNSWYRDPFLTAIHRESGAGAAVDEPWFTGYETEPRWMRLAASGTGLRCVNEGFVLRPPSAPAHAEAFLRVCAQYGVGEDSVLKVPQVNYGGRQLDTKDRVQLGAALVRDLMEAGL